MLFFLKNLLTIPHKYVRIGEQNRYVQYASLWNVISLAEGYFAYGEYTNTSLESASYSSEVWYAKRIRRARLVEPRLNGLRKWDARCASHLRRVIEVVITRRS